MSLNFAPTTTGRLGTKRILGGARFRLRAPLVPLFAAAAACLAACGCSSEKEAKETLGKFEHVFEVCRTETLKQKYEPGKHPCSLVASMALDAALRDTGVGEDKLASMRDAWIAERDLGAYYVPAEKR